MRWLHFILFAASASALGQATAKYDFPEDPRELLSAVAPAYEFNSPTLKPWHLKATYQLYDVNGNPSEQGTYEYWWASPQVYRSTWTRSGATQTDWNMTGGKHAHEVTGDRLHFFEYKLRTALLSPLPDLTDLDPEHFRLERQSVDGGNSLKMPCIMVAPVMSRYPPDWKAAPGLFSTYCFDPAHPILRASYSYGAVTTEFNKIVKMQDHYLAREIVFLEAKRKILSATVDSIDGLSEDSVFTPPPGASEGRVAAVYSNSNFPGSMIRKVSPEYPKDAKAGHISGVVVIHAIISFDGTVHEMKVVSAPWPSLAAAALSCVSQWQYTPFKQNGQPVEVEADLRVIFSLKE